MRSDKAVRLLRIVAVLCIAVLSTITVTQIDSAGLKAPLLTMMGSSTIIMVLLSIDRTAITVQNIGTIFGTAVVVVGGVYWLIDARQRSSADDLAVSSFMLNGLMVLLLIYVISVLIPTIFNLALRIRSR